MNAVLHLYTEPWTEHRYKNDLKKSEHKITCVELIRFELTSKIIVLLNFYDVYT